MNGCPALSRKFHVRALGAWGLGAGFGALLALGGCADVRRAVSPPPVNPESPVAAQVNAAARRHADTPRLIDVPPIPKDVPLPGDMKRGVLTMVRCRGGVEQFARTHPPLSSGAATYAADARDIAHVNPADVPPPDSAARSADAAAELRAFAAPPAAIASGPAPTPDEGKPPGPAAPRPVASKAAPRHAPPAAAAPSAPPAAGAAPAAAGSTLAANAAGPASGTPAFPAPRSDPLQARCR